MERGMERVRIATWNTQCGDFADNPAVDDKLPEPNLDYIIQCVDNTKAEIVCLQEALFPHGVSASHAASIAESLGYKYCEEWDLSETPLAANARMGIAILSKYPLKNIKRIPLPNPELNLLADNGFTIET